MGERQEERQFLFGRRKNFCDQLFIVSINYQKFLFKKMKTPKEFLNLLLLPKTNKPQNVCKN